MLCTAILIPVLFPTYGSKLCLESNKKLISRCLTLPVCNNVFIIEPFIYLYYSCTRVPVCNSLCTSRGMGLGDGGVGNYGSESYSSHMGSSFRSHSVKCWICVGCFVIWRKGGLWRTCFNADMAYILDITCIEYIMIYKKDGRLYARICRCWKYNGQFWGGGGGEE